MRTPLVEPVTAQRLIAIGCSAGGLAILRQLMPAFSTDCDAAVVIVSHLPVDGPNLLPQLLSIECRLPITEAVEREPVGSGRVYVAPANYHLLIEKEKTFSLSVDAKICHVRPAIDLLFSSAAEAYQEAVLGLLLTGANEYGTQGLRDIQRTGGETWVQDPDTAVAEQMPLAAIQAGVADRILSPAVLASELARWCQQGNGC